MAFFLVAFPCWLYAQPNANFNSNITSGCSPIVVSFNDLSTGSPTSWFWDFGNSNTSTLQNPQTSYTTPGTYTVKLTVSNGSGSNTITKTSYITVFKNPVAAFSASTPTVGCAPFTVGFIDQSNIGDAIITQWIWDFGDGNTSNLKNPTYTFNSPGLYSISLYVKDLNGCSDTRVVTSFVKVYSLPKAGFNVNQQYYCKTPANVTFTNISSGNLPLSYYWNFGDNSTSKAKDTVHSYSNPGNYTVKLVITDTYGCKDSIIKQNNISIDNVKADFKPNSDTVCTGSFFSLNNKSTGAKSYFWRFGDGNTTSVPNPSYLYFNPGTYKVTLIVSNGSNCVDSTFRNIVVESVSAKFIMTGTLSSCKPPLLISFTNQSTNGVKYKWYFGDGDSSDKTNPIHLFNKAGVFTPQLIVYGAGGCKQVYNAPGTIEIVPPGANFTVDSSKGCAPMTVHFTEQSSSKEPITSWKWYFDDGDSSTLKNPVHTFYKDTTYFVKLIIVNSAGCTDTAEMPIKVGVRPKALFTLNPDTSCAYDSVWFYNKSFNPTGKPCDEFYWTFGDGMTDIGDSVYHRHVDTGYMSTQLVVGYNGCYDTIKKDSILYIYGPISIVTFQQDCKKPFDVLFSNQHKAMHHWEIIYGDGDKKSHLTLDTISHKYKQLGIYQVKATAFNDSTGCHWITMLNVSVQEVKADFKTDKKHLCAEDSFLFLNAGIGGSIHYWDFGDGKNGFGQNPKHAYKNPGIYKVKIVSREFGGCTDSITKYVKVYSVQAKFTSDTFGCAPSDIRFFDQSTSDTSVYLWNYYFDDGNSSTSKNPVHTYTQKGFYSPVLIVENLAGCNDTVILTDHVIIEKPSAGFYVFDRNLCWNDTAFFSNTSLGTGLSFSWELGDGTKTNLKEPVHRYANPGKYNISLIVVDQKGCKDSILLNNYIEVQPKLKALFYADTIYANCYPLLVQFYDSSNIKDILYYEWDFGDNSMKSYLSSPAHNYSKPGVYDVKLFMITSFGCTDTFIRQQYIKIKGPVADIDIMPDTACANEPISLYITHSKDVYEFEWDFGDGIIAKKAPDSIIHLYKHSGYFFPRLLYMDSSTSCRKYAEDSVYISSVTGDFLPDILSGIVPLNVKFTGVGGSDVIAWLYDFDDSVTSTLKDPEHLFKRPDTFYVRLIVRNALGCTDTITKPIIVEPIPPVIDMPKAFTPNGDGDNDEVRVQGAGSRFEVLLDFSMYNRYGEQVFNTSDAEKGWDGYYKGKLQAVDNYVYLVTVRLFDGSIVTLKGFIALIL